MKFGLGNYIMYACLAIFSLTLANSAYAQSRVLEVSIDGSHSKNSGSIKSNDRRTLGLELGIPISDYLELGAGYTLFHDKSKRDGPDAESDEEDQIEAGYRVSQEEILQAMDATLNTSIRVQIKMVVPFLFGGAVWRTLCYENDFKDYGCEGKKMAWNAGAGIAVYLTKSMKARIRYGLSPAVSLEKKIYDSNFTFGLTYSL